MKIEKKYHFYAAHRNIYADAKCARIHGHTYFVHAKFQFEEIKDSGVCMLFSDIDKIMEPIVKRFDHYLLLSSSDKLAKVLHKLGEPFISLPFETSAENMSIYFWEKIKEKIPQLIELSIKETQSSTVTYEG